MGTQKRQVFSKEFKLNAIKMAESGEFKISELSRDLGISENLLYQWRLQYKAQKEESFPGKGHLSQTDAYIRKLEMENKRLRDERDILKKAAIFFAKEP